MKSFKKITVLITLLSLSSCALGMKTELDLQFDAISESLDDLRQEVDDLTARVTALEGSQGPATEPGLSFRKCDDDNCKNISAKKFRNLQGKPRANRTLYRCYKGRCIPTGFVQHTSLQDKFLELQELYGVPKSTQAEIAGVKIVGRQRANQAQMNTDRSKLNELLSREKIDEAQIEREIKKFEELRPARWPQPDDYRKLLKARLQK